MQLWVWRHIRVELPEDWEMLQFSRLMTFLGAANALSTLYLGIHWGIDVAGGLALALVAYGLARFLSRRWAEGPDAALSHD